MNLPQEKSKIESTNRNQRRWKAAVYGFTLTLALVFGRWAWAQTAPVLTVAPTGTNTLSITVTNGTSTGNYELWTTPVLNDLEDYPWTTVAAGTGLTNFIVPIGPYPVGFFRAVLDTNSIPLWELADPNNPNSGILNVWIDSPANGSTLN